MISNSDQQTAAEIHHARVEIARLRGELEAMKQSPSWRITKPLRAIKHIVKKPTRGNS